MLSVDSFVMASMSAVRGFRNRLEAQWPPSSSSSASSLARPMTSLASYPKSRKESKFRAHKRPPRNIHQPLPAKKLDQLVSLHHSAASFMHNIGDIRTGFENAFKHTKSDPYFLKYSAWRENVLAINAEGKKIIERPRTVPLGKELDRRAMLRPAATIWRTFDKHEDEEEVRWSQKGSRDGYLLTERERRVKEALFGTWERGGAGMKEVQPSLTGVREWLRALNVSEEDFAKQWRNRHQEEDPQRVAGVDEDEAIAIEGAVAEEIGEGTAEAVSPDSVESESTEEANSGFGTSASGREIGSERDEDHETTEAPSR